MSLVFVKVEDNSCERYKEILKTVRYGNVDEIRVLCSELDEGLIKRADKLMSELYGRLIEILGEIGKLYDFLATDEDKRNLYKYFRGYQTPYSVVRCMRMAVLMYYNLKYKKYDSEVDRFISVYERLSGDCGGNFMDFVSIEDCVGVGELHEIKACEDELRERFLVCLIRGEYLTAYSMLGLSK